MKHMNITLQNSLTESKYHQIKTLQARKSILKFNWERKAGNYKNVEFGECVHMWYPAKTSMRHKMYAQASRKPNAKNPLPEHYDSIWKI